MTNQHFQDQENSDYAGIEELHVTKNFLPNYNLDVVKKLSSNSETACDVLEFGAGLGALAEIWHEINNVKPECLEIDASLRNCLTELGFTTYKDIDSIDKKFDIIYSSNVLEHIKDDVEALVQLHTKIKIGGEIAIYVPAFPSLYSKLDASVGHYRRYKKKELVDKLQSAGFQIEKICYADSIGFFAWLYTKAINSMSGSSNALGNKNSLYIYDTFIFPLSKFLDAIGLRYLFGKNLFVLAKKRK